MSKGLAQPNGTAVSATRTHARYVILLLIFMATTFNYLWRGRSRTSARKLPIITGLLFSSVIVGPLRRLELASSA